MCQDTHALVAYHANHAIHKSSLVFHKGFLGPYDKMYFAEIGRGGEGKTCYSIFVHLGLAKVENHIKSVGVWERLSQFVLFSCLNIAQAFWYSISSIFSMFLAPSLICPYKTHLCRSRREARSLPFPHWHPGGSQGGGAGKGTLRHVTLVPILTLNAPPYHFCYQDQLWTMNLLSMN